MTEQGIILKGIGGFYYVDTGTDVVECKARGKFRIGMGKPIVGDRVEIERQSDGTGYMLGICARKNELIRPAVANLDQLVVIASEAPPETDTFLIDKVAAIAEHKEIDVLIVINKQDINNGDRFYDIYAGAGFDVLRVSAHTGEGIDALKKRLDGKISAFAGNSGVGKSSLLNRIDNRFEVKVGEISRKISRGKHTTRHVELLHLESGGFVADTPGFSSFETEQMDLVLKNELQYCFREFSQYIGDCQFTGCAHVKEKGCAILAAVEAGEIARERHDSYVKLYESVKNLKEWELNK